jgi:hypothetical protein
MKLWDKSHNIVSGVDLLTLFLVQQPFGTVNIFRRLKQSSLQNDVSKITIKFLRVINVWGKSHNIVSGVNVLTLFLVQQPFGTVNIFRHLKQSSLQKDVSKITLKFL